LLIVLFIKAMHAVTKKLTWKYAFIGLVLSGVLLIVVLNKFPNKMYPALYLVNEEIAVFIYSLHKRC
jgi:hypothetical protein